MKTLPDNPNLDHLRRQAKDLLAGLRESRPEASLADAQASLAEQYGFRAWTDLKAEVDRQRGRADVAAAGWRPGGGAVTEAEWLELAAKARARRVDWASALTAAVPTLVDLASIGESAPAPAPVLCHMNLNPGHVRLGPNGRLVVLGWEHAGGLPPSWELGWALTHWAIAPGGVNAAGARALVDGYCSVAGSPPPLSLDMFRGAVVSAANYVLGQVEHALCARDAEDDRHAARSVRHLLSQPPSRDNLERLLEVVSA